MKIYPLLRVSQVRSCSRLGENISDRIEMIGNIYDIRGESEFPSTEYPLTMHRTVSNETTLASEIPNIINEKNVIIAPGQKRPLSISSDEFCKEQLFSCVLPTSKYGYNDPLDIPLSLVHNLIKSY